MTFLQIAISTDSLVSNANLVPATTVSESTFSIIDLLIKGGFIMIPIGILFAGGIFIFIERYISIHRATLKDNGFIQQLETFVTQDKTDDALTLCSERDDAFARIMGKGLKRLGNGNTVKDVEEAIEVEGKFEVTEMEKGLQLLAVIAGIAPMFGFLGTIIGVIKIFFDISQTADISIAVVSAGLYVKMVSSAAGLIVGIMAYVFYNWLNLKIERISTKMERKSMNFIDFLKDRKK